MSVCSPSTFEANAKGVNTQASRKEAWGYYISRQGRQTLLKRDSGQRIQIYGVSEALVLEPRRNRLWFGS